MSANQSHTDAVITRITKLNLHNFRGFKRDQAIELDTDADLVLIMGPNGHGKSSLLEALLLLLTGWHDRRDPVQDLISRQMTTVAGEHAEPCERCELRASVRTENANGQPETTEAEGEASLHLLWTRDHEGSLSLPDGLPISQLLTDTEVYSERELDARLCGFFQDRVENLFDEAASGRTLRDVFESVPLALRQIYSALPEVDEELKRKVNDYEQGTPSEPDYEALNSTYQRLRLWYLQLARRVQRWPQGGETPSEIGNDAVLDDFARRVVQNSRLSYDELRRTFSDTLKNQVTNQLEAARRQAGEVTAKTKELEQEIGTIKQEIERISKRYPTLERDLNVFSPANPEHPDALSIFHALAANARRWSLAQLILKCCPKTLIDRTIL